MRNWSANWSLLRVLRLGLAGIGLGALLGARWDLSFVAAATLGLSLLPSAFAARFHIALPVPFVVFITLFLFGALFMGEAFDFYDRFWWWDLVLHGSSAVGFGLTGFLLVFMLFEGDRFAAPSLAITLIAFACAVTIGTAWEIFEFLMDLGLGLNMQKSGLDDTMLDLIIDAVGAAIGASFGYLYLLGRNDGIASRLIRDFIARNRHLYRRNRE